ncbi:MAG: uroporphyrinogen decarboxylase family protein [Bacteroidales bacterium]|jgi:uroporphyrinogen decarboxylase|nr:uroporphyrinogen decarboxylase family protein [Bacteroidales bacterium]
MNGRERILEALSHRETGLIPFDLAGTTWTGITRGAYDKLRDYLNLEKKEAEWADVIQQIVIPPDEVLDLLNVDTRGLFPLTSHNWNVCEKLQDSGDRWVYNDEWGFTHHFPRENGFWFSMAGHPFENVNPETGVIDAYKWPDPSDPERISGLCEKAIRFREEGKLVILKGICAGIFEMQQRFRGVSNALVDPFLYPDFSDRLIGKIADLKIRFWQTALKELAGVVDVVAEADDYGTQESQLIDPDYFRQLYKPHISRIIKSIEEAAPDARIMFHSCGNIRPLIPDFIEMGIDIINPVHINAEGMEPNQLKKDFGSDIVFWGGGVDTQKILPSGSASEVADDVKRNIDALAPGGGFVFATVHNIQAEVPPLNIIAMLKAIGRF